MNKSPRLKEAALELFGRGSGVSTVHEFNALQNFSLTVKSGDRLGIIGLNGAGKSTLLKMIAGIYPPQVGTVNVTGKLTPLIELGTGFDEELSGRENIYLNGTMLQCPLEQLQLMEDSIIDFAELGEFIDLPIKYYSTGMRSRLAISIALFIPMEIILLDEVFATGDRPFVEKATSRFFDLLNQSKIVLFVSHDPAMLVKISNRVIVLHQGELRFDGSPDEALRYYEEEIVDIYYNGKIQALAPIVDDSNIDGHKPDPSAQESSEAVAGDCSCSGRADSNLIIGKFIAWTEKSPDPDSLAEYDKRLYASAFPLWQAGQYTEAVNLSLSSELADTLSDCSSGAILD
ncbi:MAG TPA: ABC transporter ATP-binding protein [Candidatus Melainabacteria bacterium]|nr:ABC transporter ATP-binding protein [Candidatus Melainabacteria bacterium]